MWEIRGGPRRRAAIDVAKPIGLVLKTAGGLATAPLDALSAGDPMTKQGLLQGVCLALAIVPFWAGAAPAGGIESLEGRTLRIISSGGPGSTSDHYARAFAAGVEEVLPGLTVGVQSVTGAAGSVALKELMGAKGGLLTAAVFGGGALYNQILGTATIDLDLGDIRWIGVFGGDRRVLGLRKGFGTSFEALLEGDARPLLLGPSPRSLAVLETRLINAMSGTRIRIGTGFDDALRRSMIMSGDGDVLLQGIADLQPLIDSGDLVPVLRYSRDGYPVELEGVPTLADVARPGIPSELIDVMLAFNDFSQFFGAAPATSPADVEALRALFDRAVKEPSYADKVEAMGLVNQPTPGVRVSERVSGLLSLPEESRKKIQAALDCGEALSAGRTCE